MSIRTAITGLLGALLVLCTTAAFAVQALEITEVYVDESIAPHQLIITGRNFDNGSTIELWLGEIGAPLVIESITEHPGYFTIVANLPVGIPDGSYQLVATTGGGTVRFDAFDGVTIGADGLQCWDTNSNGVADFPNEDVNNDGSINVLDCAGAVGSQGDPGDPGAQGVQGKIGPAGAPGADSTAAGPQGVQGKIGPAGAPGADSTVAGPQGVQGKIGSPGVPGAQGVQGKLGPQGPAGSANINGTTNRVIKFTGPTTGGDSQIFDDGINVGVGTTSPGETLHIAGEQRIEAGGEPSLHISSFRPSILLEDSGTAKDAYLVVNDQNFYISEGTVTSTGRKFMVELDTGNVGIGTNPAAKLHIGGTPGVDGLRFPDGTLQTTATAIGAQGVQGKIGPAGAPGADSTVAGPQGVQGKIGSPGVPGAQGVQGKIGSPGDPGAQGVQGKIGPAGADSIVPGPQGVQGKIGPQGPAGSANINGTSNYLVKFTGPTMGGVSQIFDNGSNVGIGVGASAHKLDVNGDINTQTRYRIGGTTVLQTPGTENTFLGRESGQANTSGFANTFSGRRAGYSNTTGYANTFSGNEAGRSNTTGYANTFLGDHAGAGNTIGRLNTFLGVSAGLTNTTGDQNTFLGVNAGRFNTTGFNNTFSGYMAGRSNTTGSNNTFSGMQAGYSNTTGYRNTYSGYMAGFDNTTGYGNTYSGYMAGRSNTTGISNTFSGLQAGYTNTTGSYNTFSGLQAGYSNTAGSYNTYSGYWAGRNNTNGSSNTFSGYMTGYNNLTGQGNVFLGHQAGYFETGSNKLYIANSSTTVPLIYGDFAISHVGIGTASPGNKLEVSSGSDAAPLLLRTTSGYGYMGALNAGYFHFYTDRDAFYFSKRVECNGGCVTYSDINKKQDLEPVVGALEKIAKLNGVTWNWKDKDLSRARQMGLIAQNVEEVAPELVDDTINGKTMNYDGLSALTVEAIKEQQYQIGGLKRENAALRQRLAEIEAMLGFGSIPE